MMKMMRTMVIRVIKILGVAQIIIFATYFISSTFYANLQVAATSSFLIMLGSFYAYKKMIKTQVATKSYEVDRDELDVIDDPYELYDDTPLNEADPEDLDLQQIVKEEKAKIKTFSLSAMKDGASAGFSAYRLVPYVFLVLGFIALKNNNILDISIYLPSLLVGIIVGYISSKEIFA